MSSVPASPAAKPLSANVASLMEVDQSTAQARRLRVAAGRVDVAPERGPGEHDAHDRREGDHDGDRPGEARELGRGDPLEVGALERDDEVSCVRAPPARRPRTTRRGVAVGELMRKRVTTTPLTMPTARPTAQPPMTASQTGPPCWAIEAEVTAASA
ncbi:MAG: hypothetical protein U0869_06150 [Chloroflexota bacterium]